VMVDDNKTMTNHTCANAKAVASAEWLCPECGQQWKYLEFGWVALMPLVHKPAIFMPPTRGDGRSR
jgi:hypothetical protein